MAVVITYRNCPSAGGRLGTRGNPATVAILCHDADRHNMLIKGSFPPLLATITDADKWPMVARNYPRVWQLLPLLRSLAEKAFERTSESDHIQSLGVYGLGRQCLEDFLEILTLTENQLHVGAQKLLRGLFERLVVADVIADDRQEAEKFSNFHHINVRKISNRAESAYENPNYFADVEDQRPTYELKRDSGIEGGRLRTSNSRQRRCSQGRALEWAWAQRKQRNKPMRST